MNTRRKLPGFFAWLNFAGHCAGVIAVAAAAALKVDFVTSAAVTVIYGICVGTITWKMDEQEWVSICHKTENGVLSQGHKPHNYIVRVG